MGSGGKDAVRVGWRVGGEDDEEGPGIVAGDEGLDTFV